MSARAGPIGADEFDALMSRLGLWAADRRLAVAVSGGRDSLALALLAARWSGPGRTVGFVVDHGLRPGSAAEAVRAATRLAAIGVAPVRLALDGLQPGAGLMARARDARTAAISRACRERGLVDLLLGHHLGDQDETLRMRAARGTGPLGAAGMSRIAERADLRLVRPLLDIAPARLAATLGAAGLGWDEDPTNLDPRFLRARLRVAPDGRPRDPAGLAAARREAEAGSRRWLARHASVSDAGYALLPAAPMPELALAALLRTLSGAIHPPPQTCVRALAARPRPATLHGVRLLPAPRRLGGGLIACREVAAIAADIALADGALADGALADGAFWDRRFRVTVDGPSGDLAGTGLRLGALGPQGAAAIARRDRAGLPASVLAGLPAIRDRTGLVLAVPHLAPRDALGRAIARVEVGRSHHEFSVMFAPAMPLGGDFFTPVRQDRETSSAAGAPGGCLWQTGRGP